MMNKAAKAQEDNTKMQSFKQNKSDFASSLSEKG
jgi:hypothetical protein